MEAAESKIATVVVRGATENYMDDIERAIDDGVNTYKGGYFFKKKTFCPFSFCQKNIFYSLDPNQFNKLLILNFHKIYIK